MASILDLLNTQTGDEFIEKASRNTNENKDKVTLVMAMALPLNPGAMKRKPRDSEGGRSLDQALQSKKHDGSLLNKLGKVNESDLQNEGSVILNHVPGWVENKIELPLPLERF